MLVKGNWQISANVPTIFFWVDQLPNAFWHHSWSNRFVVFFLKFNFSWIYFLIRRFSQQTILFEYGAK